MGRALITLAAVLCWVGCRPPGAPARPGQPPATATVDDVLRGMQQVLPRRDLLGLARLFDAHCRHSCAGFVPLPLRSNAGSQVGLWTSRVNRGYFLMDFARVLASYGQQPLWVELRPLRRALFHGRALLRLRLTLGGEDAEGARRVDGGILDLDLRQGPAGWKIHGIQAAEMITLLREPESVGQRAVSELRPAGSRPNWPGRPVAPLLGDWDGDGYPDRIVGQGEVVLWQRGQPGRGFTAPRRLVAAPRLSVLRLGDVDGDGRLDLLVGSFGGTSRLWRNRPDGPQVLQDLAPGGHVTDAQLGDFNGDGRLDLYLVRHGSTGQRAGGGAAEASQLLLGGARGLRRTARGRDTGGGLAACTGDLNGDGRTDLVLANERAPSRVFCGDRQRALRDCGARHGLRLPPATACALGDVDGDGRLDLLLAGARPELVQEASSGGVAGRLQQDDLWRNRSVKGRLRLQRLSLNDSGMTRAAVMLDHDNDGWLDLLLLRGSWPAVGPSPRERRPAPRAHGCGRPRLWQNLGRCRQGRCRLADAAPLLGLTDPLCAVGWGEPTRPAPAELLLLGAGRTPRALGVRGGHGLVLRLTDAHGVAVGARVTLWSGGRRQVRECTPAASGMPGGPPGWVHLGLGQALRAELVQVRWPDGSQQRFEDLPVDTVVHLRQGGYASWGTDALEPLHGGAEPDESTPDSTPDSAAGDSPPDSAPQGATGWQPPRKPLQLKVRVQGRWRQLAQLAGKRATVLLVTRTGRAEHCRWLSRALRGRAGVAGVLLPLGGGEPRCRLPVAQLSPQQVARFRAASALLPLWIVVDGGGRSRELLVGERPQLGLALDRLFRPR